MKKIILHIGRHKSGTTALQDFLAHNMDALLDRGLLYAATGRQNKQAQINQIAHHVIARQLLPRFHEASLYHELKEQFHQEIKPYETILLSSERFQNIRDPKLLLHFFEGCQISVVCYLREHLDYCRSAYAERVQNTSFYSSFNYFAENFDHQLEHSLAMWRSISQDVQIRLYDRHVLKNQNIIEDFLATLKAADIESSKTPSTRQNVTIGGNLLTFKLLANSLGLSERIVKPTLDDLGQMDARYRGPFHIDPAFAQTFREESSYNKVLQSLFDDIRSVDFSDAPPLFEPSNWQSDIALFLDHPELHSLKEHPFFEKRAR